MVWRRLSFPLLVVLLGAFHLGTKSQMVPDTQDLKAWQLLDSARHGEGGS